MLILFLAKLSWIVLLGNWGNCRSCWFSSCGQCNLLAKQFTGQLIVLVNINQPSANISHILYTHVQAQIHTELAHVRINNCVIAYLTNWHLKLMSGAARQEHRQKLILTRGHPTVYTRYVMCVCVCVSVRHSLGLSKELWPKHKPTTDAEVSDASLRSFACWVGLSVYLFVSLSVCLGVIYHATNTRLSSHQGKWDDGRGIAPTAH